MILGGNNRSEIRIFYTICQSIKNNKFDKQMMIKIYLTDFFKKYCTKFIT